MSHKPTFAILKPLFKGARPDTHGLLLKALERNGFTVLEKRETVLDRPTLERHYAHHAGKDFFDPMVEYLGSGTSVLLALDRPGGAVDALRKLAGPTAPKAGSPGLLRYDYGCHDDGVIFMNAIHASGNPEEARTEIARFFGEAFARELYE